MFHVLFFIISVVSCGVLETPRFGRKSNFFFVPGTKVTFECNQDFILVGDQRRVCTPEGRWNVPEYGYTECLREYLNYNFIYLFSNKTKYHTIITCCFSITYLYLSFENLIDHHGYISHIENNNSLSKRLLQLQEK